MENAALMAFFQRMRQDPAFQAGFRRHMGETMRGMDGDIMAMQLAMNARIAEGFLGYARDAGFPVSDGEMDALLKSVNSSLHQKMGAIFQQEFAAAIGRMMGGQAEDGAKG